jgi:hypothetical protein
MAKAKRERRTSIRTMPTDGALDALEALERAERTNQPTGPPPPQNSGAENTTEAKRETED